MPPNKCKNFGTGRSSKSTVHPFIGAFATTPPPSYRTALLSPSTMSFPPGLEEMETEKRTAHNALERQRREGLNIRFQQLAHALPSLQTIRRPSKSIIVSKSVEFVSSSISRESKYQNEIQNLLKENERLRKQARRSCQNLQRRASSTQDLGAVSRATTSTPALLEKGAGAVTLATAITKMPGNSKKRHSTPPGDLPPSKKERSTTKDAQASSGAYLQQAQSSDGAYVSPEATLPLPLSHTEDPPYWPSLPLGYCQVGLSSCRPHGSSVANETSAVPFIGQFTLMAAPGQAHSAPPTTVHTSIAAVTSPHNPIPTPTTSIQLPVQPVPQPYVPRAPLVAQPAVPTASDASRAPDRAYYYPFHDFSNAAGYPLGHADATDMMPPFPVVPASGISPYIPPPTNNTCEMAEPMNKSNGWTS